MNYAHPGYREVVTDLDDAAAHFGEFVLAQRRLLNISQRQLAKASGVSDSYLSQLERGLYKPSADVLKGLAKAFNLPVTKVFSESGLLDDERGDAGRLDVSDAVNADPRLSPEQRSVLLATYRAFVGPADSAD